MKTSLLFVLFFQSVSVQVKDVVKDSITGKPHNIQLKDKNLTFAG